MLTETEQVQETEEEEDKKKNKIIVLEMDGIVIEKIPMNFVVYKSDTVYARSYFSSLPGALVEVSNRLFTEKLSKRQSEEEKDIKELIKMIKNHHDEIMMKFKDLNF